MYCNPATHNQLAVWQKGFVNTCVWHPDPRLAYCFDGTHHPVFINRVPNWHLPAMPAGCKVVFDNNKCDVIFNGKVILSGYKDSSTDLWTLLVPTKVCTTPEPTILSQPGPCVGHAPHPLIAASDAHPGITLARLFEWDYVNRTVNILMPGYIKKKLQEYKHVTAKKLQTCPYTPGQIKSAWRNKPPSPPPTNYQNLMQRE